MREGVSAIRAALRPRMFWCDLGWQTSVSHAHFKAFPESSPTFENDDDEERPQISAR
jgi:hypothetical protein